MTDTRLPRLGDRADLRIEITPAAVTTYRLSVTWRSLTDDEAREELDDVLRHSYVVSSIGDSMQVRGRVRRLEVDAESNLLRVSATHVRCLYATARRLDTRLSAAGSGRGPGVYRVRDEAGKRIGFLRHSGTALEWRPVAPSSGAPAEDWGPVPGDLLTRAGARFRDAIRAWIERQ